MTARQPPARPQWTGRPACSGRWSWLAGLLTIALLASAVIVSLQTVALRSDATDTEPVAEAGEAAMPSSSLPLAAQIVACRDDPALPKLTQQVIFDPTEGTLIRLASGGESAVIAYHPVPGAKRAILWLSGADGGLDGPFDGFYAQLAKRFQAQGYASARLEYKAPTNLEVSVAEAQLALRFLAQEGICNVGVVGFSFGGAVAIDTAAREPNVQAVVTLASQSLGTDAVGAIAPRPLLVIYPVGDEVVPGWASEDIFARAGEPKELIALLARDHYLSDAATDVEGLLLSWLPARLGGAAAMEATH